MDIIENCNLYKLSKHKKLCVIPKLNLREVNLILEIGKAISLNEKVILFFECEYCKFPNSVMDFTNKWENMWMMNVGKIWV